MATASAAVPRKEGGDFAVDVADQRRAMAGTEQIDLHGQQAASALSSQVRRVHILVGDKGEAAAGVGEQVAAEERSARRRAPQKTVLRECRSRQSNGSEPARQFGARAVAGVRFLV